MPYSAKDVRARRRIERILLVGPPKSGKTHCAVKTAPRPYVFNADGKGALDGPVSHGAEFVAEDITSMKGYTRAFGYLKQNIKEFDTAVFDNVSSFSMILEEEIRGRVRDDPRIIYPELKRSMTRVIRDLIALPINVIIIGHVDPGADAAEGGFDHMLSVSGGAKITIPMLIQDWIWLEVTVDGNEIKREFLLSPAGTWKKAVRSIKDVARMEADFTKFFALASQGSTYIEGTDVPVVDEDEEDVVENETDVDDTQTVSTDAATDDAIVATDDVIDEAQAAGYAADGEDDTGLPELITPSDDADSVNAALATPEAKPAAWKPNNGKKNGALPRASAKKSTQQTQRR